MQTDNGNANKITAFAFLKLYKKSLVTHCFLCSYNKKKYKFTFTFMVIYKQIALITDYTKP